MSYDRPELVAIDPAGCGCTECLTGEYKPADQATEDDMRRLFAGELRDNASIFFSITQCSSDEDDGFDVYCSSGPEFHIDTIALPITAERYTIQLDQELFEKVLNGYPDSIGKDS